MYLPRTSSSPEQPVDCSSPNFPAELVVAAVSNWWQQFKCSAASTVSPTIADTAAVLMPCVGRGCCRYRLALLPCCQWRHQCWQWLQSWRSSIVWELAKEFRAVEVRTCETLNKKCQISLTVTWHCQAHVRHVVTSEKLVRFFKLIVFLAVQDSSIGDLVTHWLSESGHFWFQRH